VLSFIASAALIGSVAVRRALSPRAAADSSRNRIHAIWVDMGKGSSFIFHHVALLFVVLAMAAGLFTIGCFAPLISIYVRDTLHARAGAFGIVSAMVGVGMIVGTQMVRQIAQRMAHDILVLSGLAGIGAGVFLLGAVPLLAATLTATFTIGFAFTAIMVPAQTLMQRETPHDMLGRVASTQISVVFLAQIVGLVLSGTLAELFGVRAVFFLCTALALALVLAGRMFLRSSAPRHVSR
jgi:predicted MFS family arabinose efflux permease